MLQKLEANSTNEMNIRRMSNIRTMEQDRKSWSKCILRPPGQTHRKQLALLQN